MPRNPHCLGCSLAAANPDGSRCVWGVGPPHAEILLVGEALGEHEAARQEPFVGPAGTELNRALFRAGLSREAVYITNVNKCRPPGNRTPTPDEQKACLGYLLEEIEAVRPKVVMALGGAALKALTGKDAVTKDRGRALTARPELRLSGTTVLATWHPAYYLHRQDRTILSQLTADLALARRTAYGTIEEGGGRTAVLPPVTDEKIRAALEPLVGAKEVACDLEWTGANDGKMRWPWFPGAQVYCMSFSGRVEGRVFYVGISHLERRPFPALQDFFSAHPIIAHNVQSDLLWLTALGYNVRVAGDTMLLAYALDETQGLSLEQLATTHTDVKAGWKRPVWPNPPQGAEEWQELLGHNMGDTAATLQLHGRLMSLLKSKPEPERTNIARVYKRLLLPAAVVLTRMAAAGMGLDITVLDKTIAESRTELRRLGMEYGAVLGVDGDAAVAIASSPQKTLVTLRQRGIAVPNTREDALVDYVDRHEVRLTKAIRHERKMMGTYLVPWRKMALRDRRLHTIYRLTGTRTGRTSAEVEEGGSLQVAPREDRIRQQLRAAPGNVLVAADESQVELRIAAWFAGERRMLEAFKDPANDLHKTTAGFNVAASRDNLDPDRFWARRREYEARVTLKERQSGKSENFGLVYGMGWQRFQRYLLQEYGIRTTDAEAQRYHANYHLLYPDLHPWHRKCVDDFNRLGYTVTPFGRYRRHIEDPHKAINTPVQTTANDVVMLAMIEIDTELRDRHMRSVLVGFVHDNLMTEGPPDEAQAVASVLERHMTHPPTERLGFRLSDMPVPLRVDVKIGTYWT